MGDLLYWHRDGPTTLAEYQATWVHMAMQEEYLGMRHTDYGRPYMPEDRRMKRQQYRDEIANGRWP